MGRMKDIFCDMSDVVTSVKNGDCLQIKDVLKAFCEPSFKEWRKNIFDGVLSTSVWRDCFGDWVYLSHYQNGVVWDITILDSENNSITYDFVREWA
jgi:hypothetical protein